MLPPSGIPLGSLQGGFEYIEHYKTELRDLTTWDAAGKVSKAATEKGMAAALAQ